MKNLIKLLLLIAVAYDAQGKQRTQYDDISRDLLNCINNVETRIINMPKVDVQQLLIEDSQVNPTCGKIRYGKCFDETFSINDGVWTKYKGGKIWSLTLKSAGALSLEFCLGNIKINKESRLAIKDAHGNLYDEFMFQDNAQERNQKIRTTGEQATIYLYESQECYVTPTLNICNVTHVYRDVHSLKTETSSCYVDVACHSEYSNESNGIAMIEFYTNGYYFRGSGALVMNTANNFKPYILTAFHIIDVDDNHSLSDTEIANCANMRFSFNYKKEDCESSVLSNHYVYYTGAVLRAAWCDSDFALLEINDSNNIVQNNLYLRWLGWDRSATMPTKSICMHHPYDYDYMNISIDNDMASSSNRNGSLATEHWVANFDEGIVWRGSSGAPLLNQDKRVVGQLHGNYNNSNDVCNMTEVFYGKISESWNGGGTSFTRLKDWLDPNGTCSITTNSSTLTSRMHITGPTIPDNNSQYSIANMPIGFTVTSWSYSGIGSPSVSVNGNTCTLTNPNKDYVKGTLTAEVAIGGIIIKTLTKAINSGINFNGSYSQVGGQVIAPIGGSTYYDPIPATAFADCGFVAIHSQLTATIASTWFNHSTLSDRTGSFPTTWSQSGGIITYTIPRSGGRFVWVTGRSNDSYDVYQFVVAPMPEPLAGNIRLDLQANDGALILDIVNTSDNCNDYNGTSNIDKYYADANYHVFVSNMQTGNIVVNENMKGLPQNISTTGWPSGIYVVKTNISGIQLEGKAIIK